MRNRGGLAGLLGGCVGVMWGGCAGSASTSNVPPSSMSTVASSSSLSSSADGSSSSTSSNSTSSNSSSGGGSTGAVVTWTYARHMFMRGVAGTDTAVDVSSRLSAAAPPQGRWLVPSANARHFAFSADRMDGDGEVLHVASADFSVVDKVRVEGAPVYVEGMPAISNDGTVVVYAASGTTHEIDLFRVQKSGSTWGTPVELTTQSSMAFNNQPSLSRDGQRVLFNCGAFRDPETGNNHACSVGLQGGAVELRVAHTVLPNGRNTFVNFPRDAGGDRVVFEGSWPQDSQQPPETIWQRVGSAAPTPAVPRTFDNSVSPCVLADGSLVVLWLGRPGGTGAHELTHIRADGTFTTLTPDLDVDDIGIGCAGTPGG